jgi:hypothetical protein
MNISLHIDRLILDSSLAHNAAEASQLQAALEAELSRLLTEGGLSLTALAGADQISAGTAVPFLQAPPVSSYNGPANLGTQVAHSIYTSFGSSKK